MNFRHHNGTLLSLVALVCLGAGTGPVMAQQSIDLSSSFYSQGRYESNFLRLSDGEKAANPQLETEDYILVVGGSLNAEVPFGRQSLILDAAVSYDFHNNNSRFDRDTINASAGLDWRVGARCSGFAGYQFNRQLNDFETLANLLKNQQQTHSVSGDAQCRVTGRIALSGGANILWLDNSEPVLRISDRKEYGYRGGLRLLTGPEQYIGVSYQYTKREFPERFAITGAESSNDQYFVGAEVAQKFGGRLLLTGQAGLVEVKDKFDPTARFKGFDATVSLDYKLSPRLQILAKGGRGVTAANSLGVPFSIDSFAVVGISYTPSRKISLRLDGNARKRSFRQAGAAAQDNLNLPPEDTTYAISGRLSYRLGRILNIDVGGGYDRRSSDLALFEYSGASAHIGLRLAFD